MEPKYKKPEFVEILRSKYSYDPDTGIITGPRGPLSTKCTSTNRYPMLKMATVATGRASVRQHIAAYFLHTGEFPKQNMDHINGNTCDNRWSNLRLCSIEENMRNCVLTAYDKPYPGVEFTDNKRDGYRGKTRPGGRGKIKCYFGPKRQYQVEAWLDRVELFKRSGQYQDKFLELNLYLPKAALEIMALESFETTE